MTGNSFGLFEWLGYESVDAPGFAPRLEGAIAESEGRFEDSIAAYRTSLEENPDDEITERRINWLGELVEAQRSPVNIPTEVLERYAGTYGPRVLTLVEGELLYEREGGTRYRLIPLSQALFAFDGLTEFRLEVALNESGRPTKLIGHYVEGNIDESPRDP